MTSKDIPRRTLIERALWVANRLREVGVRVDARSRFGQIERIAARLQPDPHPLLEGNPDLLPMAHGVRDLLEMEYILHHLWLDGVPPAERDRVQRLNQDDVLPAANLRKTQGRDLQFEMLVEAKCVAGGLDAHADETTDIRCSIAGRSFGVACKRCQTDVSVVRACRSASEQIVGSAAPGVIAIEVSLVVNPSAGFLKIADHALAAITIKTKVDDLLNRLAKRILGVVDRERVARAYFFVGFVREPGPLLADLDGLTMRFPVQRGGEVLHRKSLLAFDAGLMSGTPNLTN